MTGFKSAAIAAMVLVALTGCTRTAVPAPDKTADEAAIRAVNPVWFKAYNAGDADGISALYAEEAVFNAPGAPAARGRAAIGEYFKKNMAAATAAGLAFNPGPTTDVGVSGDVGWEWGTYTVTDKSGATVDAGKYLTVVQRKDGKWQIVQDIYNSDTAPAAAAPTK